MNTVSEKLDYLNSLQFQRVAIQRAEIDGGRPPATIQADKVKMAKEIEAEQEALKKHGYVPVLWWCEAPYRYFNVKQIKQYATEAGIQLEDVNPDGLTRLWATVENDQALKTLIGVLWAERRKDGKTSQEEG